MLYCYSIFGFICMFCRSLFVLFPLAIVLSVDPSSIQGFWVPLWYLQTLLPTSYSPYEEDFLNDFISSDLTYTVFQFYFSFFYITPFRNMNGKYTFISALCIMNYSGNKMQWHFSLFYENGILAVHFFPLSRD